MNTRTLRLTLLGLALGVLLALVIAPQTRWLVWAQLFPGRLTPGRYEQQKQAFVRSRPSDYQVQLAGKPDGTSVVQIAYARSLVSRFPNSASLRANILRYATLGAVHMHRNESYFVENAPIPAYDAAPGHPPSTPAQLAAFDADAAAGERLDPDNAYFPFMRAIGLFAANRDAEGLAAVQRASTKHVWQEYYQDEAEGGWRISRTIYGGQETIAVAAVSASLLFPHYQQLRAVARIVVYKAVLDEQAGHFEAGLAKRNAIGRCGKVMEIKSTVLIGNLVGVAINSISRYRPGGAPPLAANTNLSDKEQMQKRLDLYCAYVVKIGHPEAAAQARADVADWQQIRRITSHLDDFYFGMGLSRINHLMVALIAGWIIFPAIFVLLALGLVAAGLKRLPRVQAGLPLPAGATVGFWGLVVTSAALIWVYFNAGPIDFPIYVPVLLLPPLLFIAFRVGFRPQSRRPIRTALLTVGVTLGALGLLAAVVSWQMRGGMELITTMQQMLGLSADANGNPPATDNVPWLQIALGVAVTLALPLLTAIVLSIWSRVKRVPASVGLIMGFQAIMPALVLGLMLVYAGLAVWTIRQEAQASYGLARSLHGEGQYLAQVHGLAWPGPVK